MQARALVTDGRGGIAVEAIEVDPPGPGEVLVEIRASGVCHTDDKFRTRGKVQVLGHEGAGVVSAVGAGVKAAAPGDRVLLNWAIPCGACFQCRRGAENLCENQPSVPDARRRLRGAPLAAAFGLGTMSTLSVVPEAAVVRIDVEIPFPSAALLGCGVMTGVGSVHNVAKVRAGESVAVIGCGGVGLSVVQGARLAGAGMIVAVDVVPARLETARSLGATHAVLADRADAGLREAAARVRATAGGRGVDYAFECTSVPALCAAPLAFVRNGGTALQLSGTEQPVSVDMELFEWDKTYLNPLYGKCRPKEDFPRLLRWYREGGLKLDEMVTRTYPLADAPRAFEDMLAGRNAKGVLVME